MSTKMLLIIGNSLLIINISLLLFVYLTFIFLNQECIYKNCEVVEILEKYDVEDLNINNINNIDRIEWIDNDSNCYIETYNSYAFVNKREIQLSKDNIKNIFKFKNIIFYSDNKEMVYKYYYMIRKELK